MATSREPPTLADYVITAISPALIMGLVGSLVFFLAELFYVGKYETRLLYTFFCFVFGIVLVARVAVVVDASRSLLYGIALAGAAWVAMQAYVDVPADSPAAPFSGAINAALIAVVWWCSTKLVWDCTFIDERRESSSRGLLAAAGMEQRHRELNRGRHVVEDEPEEEPRANLPLSERWRRFRAVRAKRPHTPGVTVIYFSLAALPIFGLGQSLIPSDDSARRRFTFFLAAVYVGCALGLLLTTSFLGLRRYLRQRRLKMPASMTGVWMGLGAILVAAFLVAGAVLPRPYSETPVIRLGRVSSTERQASKNAQLRDSATKGEGARGNEAEKGDKGGTAKGADPGGSGRSGDAEKGNGSDEGKKAGSGREKGKDEGSGKNQDGAKGEKQGKDGSKEGDRPSDRAAKKDSNQSDSLERFQNSGLGSAVSKLGTLLKWIAFGLVVLAVLFLLFRRSLGYLANFMPWARRLYDAIAAWWDRLFGRRPPRAQADSSSAEDTGPTHVPFSEFSNPFAGGSSRWPLPELVAYSFAGLEAWAADRDTARRPDETPLEFAERLEAEFPALEPEASRLADLVVRLAYAGGSLPANASQVLELFWGRVTEPLELAVRD